MVLTYYSIVHGITRGILTKHGCASEFKQFFYFFKLFRISEIFTSEYCPQTNGIRDRFD